MKKVLLLSFVMIFMVACGHEHEYTTEVTKEATCTEAGVLTYTCVKGDDSYTEEVAALGHSTDLGECERCDDFVNLEHAFSVVKIVGEGLDAINTGLDEGVKSDNYYRNFLHAIEYFKKAFTNLEKGKELCGDYTFFRKLKIQINKVMNLLPLSINGSDADSMIAFSEQCMELANGLDGISDEGLRLIEVLGKYTE